MRVLIAASAFLFLSAPSEVVHPIAAWAISSQEHGKETIRAVILQMDETRAVVGFNGATVGLSVDGNQMKAGELSTLPLDSIFEIGNSAPLKRKVVVICGDDGPSI